MLLKLKELVGSETGKDTFIVSTGTVINIIAGGLFFIIAPRILGPNDYGLFSTVIAVGILVNSISNFGIDTGILKFAKKNTHEFHNTLSIAIKSYLIFGLVLTLTGLYFSPFIAEYLNQPQITNILRIAFTGNILLILSNFYVAGLQAKGEFLKASLVNIVSNVSRLILLILAMYLFIVGLKLLTIIFFGSLLASVIAGKYLLPFQYKKTTKNDFVKFHKYNMWIAFSLIVSSIPMDNFILLKVSGPVQAGIYAAPFKILVFIYQLGGNFSRVIASRLSSFDTKEKVISYSRKSSFIIAIFIVGLSIGIILAKPIIEILFGNEFRESVVIFQVLSLGFIFFLASIIPSSVILYFLGKSDVSFKITVSKYVLFLLSLLFFVPQFGALGAAAAFTFAELISFLLMTSYSYFKLNFLKSG